MVETKRKKGVNLEGVVTLGPSAERTLGNAKCEYRPGQELPQGTLPIRVREFINIKVSTRVKFARTTRCS